MLLVHAQKRRIADQHLIVELGVKTHTAHTHTHTWYRRRYAHFYTFTDLDSRHRSRKRGEHVLLAPLSR